MRCEIKKGIFVLRTCDAKSFVVCATCRRPVCAEHTDKSSSSRIICVECAAQDYTQQQKQTGGKGVVRNINQHEHLDTFWYYMTRNNFHTVHSSYRPFTAREQREFDKPIENESNLDLEGEASSFLDS